MTFNYCHKQYNTILPTKQTGWRWGEKDKVSQQLAMSGGSLLGDLFYFFGKYKARVRNWGNSDMWQKIEES